MNTTVARPTTSEASHFYLNGAPFYEVPYKDPTKGLRKATLADARKVGALPSTTTILRCLDRPALTAWKIEQAVLCCSTAPRQPGEELDAFIERVLHTEAQQDEAAQKAMDLGTQIHAAIEAHYKGWVVPDGMSIYVSPVVNAVDKYGPVIETESIYVGEGYAGRIDVIACRDESVTIVDLKTTKRLPAKESYPEHRLQTASYAFAYRMKYPGAPTIQTSNVYISTTNPGEIAVFEQTDWWETYENGFKPLLQVWSWLNNYYPKQNL